MRFLSGCLLAAIFTQGIFSQSYYFSDQTGANAGTITQDIYLSQLDTSAFSSKFIFQYMVPVGGYLTSQFRLWIIIGMDLSISLEPGHRFVINVLYEAPMAERNTFTGDYEISYFFPDTSSDLVATADINSDGEIDFIVQAVDKGVFSSLRYYTRSRISGYPDSLLFQQYMDPGPDLKPAIGYFDGDSQIDMILYNDGLVPGGCVSCAAFYEYEPNLAQFVLNDTICVDNPFREFAVDDYDEDGHYEFVTGSDIDAGSSLLMEFKNLGNNKYSLTDSLILPVPNMYVSRLGHDIDGDGVVEVFMAGQKYFPTYAQLYWLQHYQQGFSTKFILTIWGIDFFYPIFLDLYDVDSDGVEELVFNLSDHFLILKWRNEKKEFEILYYYQPPYHYVINSIYFSDIDNNSIPEMFVSMIREEQPSVITYVYKNNYLTYAVNDNQVPGSLNLIQNYPNPFNPTTTLSYQVGNTGFVSLCIYNLLGEKVETAVSEVKVAGTYKVRFDGTNLPSGVYFYQLVQKDKVLTKKMLLLR